jgi:cytochrome c oxidase assembly protein subunit 15
MAGLALNARVAAAPRHRVLIFAATLLALVVVGLGAYVRLSDAGLGCPDWPGCYGHLVGVPDAAHELENAAQAFPGKPVHAAKAWKEMAHRYAAGTLGLLVLAIALSAWHRRKAVATAENGLLALIVLQAALGMWTVTLLLKPVVVTLHLLGGMSTFALLVLLMRREVFPDARLPLAGRIALAAVFAQIALGGWVSSNYAALACVEFPGCRNGELLPPLAAADFAHGFTLLRELGATASGDTLPFGALTAIHLAHRAGALLVLLVVGTYGLSLLPSDRAAGRMVLGALGLQLALGVSNVLFSLPLPVAVLHNLGAAVLVAVLLGTAPARQPA